MPVPALPPYGHLNQETIQCVVEAAEHYQVPELLLHAILAKENGRNGQYSVNVNGSKDLGLAQINTSWMTEFSKYGITPERVLNNACLNVSLSAYILKYNWARQNGDWFRAIVAYNIGNERWTSLRYGIGYRYARDVVRYWWNFQDYVEISSKKEK